MNRIFAIVISLLVITGCMTTKPNYTFNANANDPVVIFNSDFELHTFFHVKIDPAGDSCSNFMLAGYILHKDSIFIYDPPNKEFQITVPADQEITIQALHDFSDPNQYSRCGPLFIAFTPKKGKIYKVVMHKIGKSCTMTIRDISATPSPVNETHFKKCSRK